MFSIYQPLPRLRHLKTREKASDSVFTKIVLIHKNKLLDFKNIFNIKASVFGYPVCICPHMSNGFIVD